MNRHFLMTMDLHNYKQRMIRQIELLQEQSDISSGNKEVVVQFKDYLLSEGIGVAKIARYLIDARKYCVMLNKAVQDATESDIRKIIGQIEQTNLAPETKKGFKVFIRKFYRFIRGINKKGEYPPEVAWISIGIPRKDRKMPEELLTEAEVKSIIRACENVRDKALISLLAESRGQSVRNRHDEDQARRV